MRAKEEELAMALRGGLRGRFQSSFHLLENAFEVLSDQMIHSITPTQYEAMRPLFDQIHEQLVLLRRLGEHSADAAVAPVLQQICVPRPMELLGQLREWCALFNEIAVQEQLEARAGVETDGGEVLLTMGDDTLLNGLLANLVSNSLAAGRCAQIVLVCGSGTLCYRDDGPGLPEDARVLLNEGRWSERLLQQGGLGLPLISAYAAAMGWQLTAREGRGTDLCFSLPSCTMDMGDVVLESAHVAPQARQQQRACLQRELYPVLYKKEDPAE